jgi:hypothetical protein
MTLLQLIKLRTAGEAIAEHALLAAHVEDKDERERLALFFLGEAAAAAGMRLVPVMEPVAPVEVVGAPV